MCWLFNLVLTKAVDQLHRTSYNVNGYLYVLHFSLCPEHNKTPFWKVCQITHVFTISV